MMMMIREFMCNYASPLKTICIKQLAAEMFIQESQEQVIQLWKSGKNKQYRGLYRSLLYFFCFLFVNNRICLAFLKALRGTETTLIKTVLAQAGLKV